ncbi:MAG: PilZ domain-containing protein [Nitrospirae bacterium]|nr:PilZ domain-containing protein [Nitrospirota bacterium]NTW66587.1 PilZ domain-containing protein [Nitrospirota bacterium]
MRTSDKTTGIDNRNEQRQADRHPLAVQRDCAMCIITFKDLAWKDHVAFLKDVSMNGVGVEAEKRIDTGFVWFRDRVGGHRGGVLMWSRQVGYSYRAGIQFVPLSRDAEEFVDSQVSLLRDDKPLHDPTAVISTIMGSLGRTRKN